MTSTAAFSRVGVEQWPAGLGEFDLPGVVVPTRAAVTGYWHADTAAVRWPIATQRRFCLIVLTSWQVMRSAGQAAVRTRFASAGGLACT